MNIWTTVHLAKSKLKSLPYHLIITWLLYRITDLQKAAHWAGSATSQHQGKAPFERLSKKCIDWAAVHQREFEKMGSLDVYVKKNVNCGDDVWRLQWNVWQHLQQNLILDSNSSRIWIRPSIRSQEGSQQCLQRQFCQQKNASFSTMFKLASVIASKSPLKPGQLRKSICEYVCLWNNHAMDCLLN